MFDTDWIEEWRLSFLLLSFDSSADGSFNEYMGSHSGAHQYRRRTSFSTQILPPKKTALQFSRFCCNQAARHCCDPSLPAEYSSRASWMIYSNIESSGVWVSCLVNAKWKKAVPAPIPSLRGQNGYSCLIITPFIFLCKIF